MTATDSFEVIAAFIDGERVDPIALKSALAAPEGRDYLAELVALREVLGRDGAAAPPEIVRAPSVRRWVVAAAAMIALSVGGIALGHELASREFRAAAAEVAAPKPTRVIKVAPAASSVIKVGR
jgi:hypothetical protein